MPQTICRCRVSSASEHIKPGPNGVGFRLPTREAVAELATACGLVCENFTAGSSILVELDDSDPKLEVFFGYVATRYGWKPTASLVIPPKERNLVYGVERTRVWTEKEISSAPILRILVNATIAKQSDGTSEQVDSEVFSYCDVSKSTQMGVVMPFHGIGVADDLVKILEKEKLRGLRFTPGVDNSGKSKRLLYALRSDLIMPPALNPLINEAGEVVPPNTEWWCFHDDGGMSPQVLRYREAEVKALGDFDIAMTHERVGYRKSAAYRWCIVSQKFREVLKKLKVRAVTYVPVELES